MAIYYSNTITSFGFNQALVQRKDITERHINSVFTFDLTISIFLAGMFYFMAPVIASFFNSPESKNVIRVLSIVFVLTTLHDMPYTLLRRNINFKTISLIDTVKEISMALITLLLAILGLKYWAIVFGQLIPLFLATIYLLYKVGWIPRISYHHASIKELFSFGIWSFINMQMYFFSTRIDRIIIGRGLTPSLLGLYDKAKSLSQMPSESIAMNINAVLFSSFSRMQHDKKELHNIFTKGLVIISMINFPIYITLYALAYPIVLVLFGEKWSAMAVTLQILSLSGFFTTFSGLFSVMIAGAGEFSKYVIRLTIAVIFLIIESLFLVKFGIEAVAIGIVLFSFMVFILNFNLIKKISDFTWAKLFICILPSVFSCLIMLSSIQVYKLFIREATILSLISMLSIGAISYLIPLMLFPGIILKEIRSSVIKDFKKVWIGIKNS